MFVAAVSQNESVLILFGSDNYRTSLACQVSLERPDTVSTIHSAPAVITYGAAACVMGDTLYAVGIGGAYNELWRWQATSDWTRCADMTSGRRGHCVAVVDSTLYTLCGVKGYTVQSSIEAYNTQTDKWSAAGELKHAVHGAACVSYKNSIYVFGGADTKDNDVARVQVYDTAQHKCTLLRRRCLERTKR